MSELPSATSLEQPQAFLAPGFSPSEPKVPHQLLVMSEGQLPTSDSNTSNDSDNKPEPETVQRVEEQPANPESAAPSTAEPTSTNVSGVASEGVIPGPVDSSMSTQFLEQTDNIPRIDASAMLESSMNAAPSLAADPSLLLAQQGQIANEAASVAQQIRDINSALHTITSMVGEKQTLAGAGGDESGNNQVSATMAQMLIQQEQLTRHQQALQQRQQYLEQQQNYIQQLTELQERVRHETPQTAMMIMSKGSVTTPVRPNQWSYPSAPMTGISAPKSRLLPKDKVERLSTWLNEHLSHPYPTKDEMLMLACQTGLTETQVTNWFNNARRRHKNLFNLPERAVKVLHAWFQEHIASPYPSPAEIDELANKTGLNLSPAAVERWISHARNLNRHLIKQAVAASRGHSATNSADHSDNESEHGSSGYLSPAHGHVMAPTRQESLLSMLGVPLPDSMSRTPSQVTTPPRVFSSSSMPPPATTLTPPRTTITPPKMTVSLPTGVSSSLSHPLISPPSMPVSPMSYGANFNLSSLSGLTNMSSLSSVSKPRAPTLTDMMTPGASLQFQQQQQQQQPQQQPQQQQSRGMMPDTQSLNVLYQAALLGQHMSVPRRPSLSDLYGASLLDQGSLNTEIGQKRKTTEESPDSKRVELSAESIHALVRQHLQQQQQQQQQQQHQEMGDHQ